MTSSTIDYGALRRNPVYNAPMWSVKVADIICALSQDSGNKTSGHLVEHRGLHFTDKRFAVESNINFIKGVPMASVTEIRRNRKAMATAISKRGKTSKKLNVPDYEMSLIVRSIRGQVLNPILRIDYFAHYKKVIERMRSVAFGSNNKRFLNMACNPANISYLTNWLIFG